MFDTIKYIHLTKEEMRFHIEQIQKYDSKKSKEILIQNSLRYIISVAKEFNQSDEIIEDLVQEGIIGFLHAITLYNPNYETLLLTYADKAIRSHMKTYLRKNINCLHFGKTEKMFKIMIEFFKLHIPKSEYLKMENINAIIKKLDAPKEDVEYVARYLTSVTPLYDTNKDGDEYLTSDLYVDNEDVDKIETMIYNQQRNEIISKTIKTYVKNKFDKRWQDIILSKFSDEPPSRNKLGEKYGFSGSRIDQIERKAFRQMAFELNYLKNI